MEDARSENRYLLVGAGMAGLAAALLLVRDAGVPGDRIRILEAGGRPGGALHSGHLPARPSLFLGDTVRSMDETSSACLWDLLGSVPTLRDPRITVLEDARAALRKARGVAGACLIGADHGDADRVLRVDPAERARMLGLLTAPDAELAGRRIDEVLPEQALASDFWILCSSAFRLRPGSSALDLKNALARRPRDLPRLYTLARAHGTRRSEYHSVIRPLHDHLRSLGVTFTYGATVTDMDLAEDADGRRRAIRLRFTTRGRSYALELGPHDHVLATLGSLTADAAVGDDRRAATMDLAHRDGTWRLWESLARAYPDLGHPSVFTSDIEDTAWLSFTLSTTTPDLHWHINRLTGGQTGARAPITLRDSPWLLTLAVPEEPRFGAQQQPAHTVLGHGMRLNRRGDFAPVTLMEATGRQIIEEVIGQLGMAREAAVIRATSRAAMVLLPYAGSPLLPRLPGDRPRPIPARAGNFAFLGQYVEIPGEVAFSMEYAARSAMHAVYGLLGVDREIPANHQALESV